MTAPKQYSIGEVYFSRLCRDEDVTGHRVETSDEHTSGRDECHAVQRTTIISQVFGVHTITVVSRHVAELLFSVVKELTVEFLS